MTTFADPAIQQIANYLQQTLEPATQKKAENELRILEPSAGFSISLLQLVSTDSVSFPIRFAASVYFKNFVKKNWEKYEGEPNKIPDPERTTIKSHLINLMISVPPKLQLQLSDAVNIIADCDFPHNWQNLIDDLIVKLTPNDFEINNGVLRTIHTIIKRWRHQFRSDPLFLEIKQVLEKFCPIFEILTIETDRHLTSALETKNKKQADLLMNTLVLIAKLYYSCTFQDLPDFFLDHQDSFFPIFKRYMEFTHPFFDKINDADVSEDEPSSLDLLKCAICEITSLFLDKYTEDWKYTEAFVEATSKLLNTVTPQPKHDTLVSKAMTLLSKIVQRPSLIAPFQNSDVLNSLVQFIVLPNMKLRSTDEEAFEDDPIQFVLRNIEGAEVDTRAHAASDLVKNLMEFFETDMLSICEVHIRNALTAYYAQPKEQYPQKDLAITLYIAATTKARLKKDVQKLFSNTTTIYQLGEFFHRHIVPDLQLPTSVHPILVMDALKFLNVFRFQIDPSIRLDILKLIAPHLSISPHGIHLWAAMVCERYLSLLPATEAASTAMSVARLIVPGLMQETQPNKLQENDVLLKTIWRCMKLGYLEIQEILPLCVHAFQLSSQNPSSPKFIHYLFECMALLIRETQARQPNQFPQLEQCLFSLLFQFFQQHPFEMQSDFLPFLLQIFAQFIDVHPSSTFPSLYQLLVSMVFNPTLFETPGNLSSLVILLKTFLRKDPTYFNQPSLLSSLLGVIQFLLKSKVHFHFGFDLLKFMVVYIHFPFLQPYLKSLFTFLFVRLNTVPKSDRFEQAFILFFTFFICTCPDLPSLINEMESIQSGITVSLMQHVIQKHLFTITGKEPRRILILGCTKLICESSLFFPSSTSSSSSSLSSASITLIQSLLTQVLKCIEYRKADLDGSDVNLSSPVLDHFLQEEDELQTQSTKLISIPMVHYVPLPNELQPRQYFYKSLKPIYDSHPSLTTLLTPFLAASQ